MKTITMKATKQGAPHGHTIKTFEEGQTYETTDDLADIFIADGHAVEGDGAKLAENADGQGVRQPDVYDAMKNDELLAEGTKLGLDLSAVKTKDERRAAIRAKLAENAAAEAAQSQT